MSNARLLKLFEIIQHCLAKGPFLIAELGVFVFQIDRFRLLELVTEQISVSEIGLDHHCVIRRELQSFERRCNRLTRFSIEKLIPGQVQVVVSIFGVQLNSFL